MSDKKTIQIGLNINKVLIILLTGLLLFFFLIKNYQTPCFSPLELFSSYIILIYNILSEILTVIITRI